MCVCVCVCVCLIGQYKTFEQVWKISDVQLVQKGKTERPSSAAESWEYCFDGEKQCRSHASSDGSSLCCVVGYYITLDRNALINIQVDFY